MEHNYLSKEIADVNVYESPVCEVIMMGAQRVIYASETEIVGEDEGEW